MEKYGLTEPLLFLGAGASRQFGLPSMKDLTKEVKKEFRMYSQDLDQIRKTLKRFHFNDDIEAILAVLKGWVRPRVAFRESGPFITQMAKCRSLRDLHVVQKYKGLVNKMENYIHKRCTVTELSVIYAICEFYDKFLQDLVSKYNLRNCSPSPVNCPYVDVFTTNYDNVIEEYCYERGVALCYGYREFAGGRLVFDPELYADAGDALRLHKLHGSVELFKLESGDIVRLNQPPRMNTLVHGRRIVERVMIYPIAGKHYFSEPYLELLSLLKKKLIESTDCFMIGYSFRDESIRSVFFDAAERNRQLRIILVSQESESIAEGELKGIKSEVLRIPKKFEDFKVLDDVDT